MNRLLLPAVLVFMLALPGYAQTTASATDETAIQTLITNFNNAFNAHDVKAFGATFAEDSDFTNWLGMSAHGRTNIEQFHVRILTEVYKNASQKMLSNTIRFIRPDVATVDIREEVTGIATPDGKAAPLPKFLVNWTVTKEANGQWLIKVMHNTRLTDLPAPVVNPK